MAGGKETPRQKMIGMMYLVLTALLALNVTKEVVNAFVTINDKLDASASIIDNKVQDDYNSFELKKMSILAKKGDMKLYSVWQPKAEELGAEANKIIGYLLSECNAMIIEGQGEDWVADGGKDSEGNITTLKPLMNIDVKDNYDIPTQLFIGSNPQDPIQRGLDLRLKIHAFRDKVAELMGTYSESGKEWSFIAPKGEGGLEEALQTVNPADADKIAQFYKSLTIPSMRYDHGEGKDLPWVSATFNHAPIVAAAALFTSLKVDVKNAESIAAEFMLDKIDEIPYIINKVEPMAFAPSGYINQGDSLDLNVLIAAFDTTELNTIKWGMDGDTLPERWKETKGKINLSGAAPGVHQVRGVIGVKERNEIVWKPWSFDYTVGQPMGVISQPQMRQLYRGYDNVVEAAASGFAADKISLSASSGCRVTRSNGKWVVHVGSGIRTATITIRGEKEDGSIVTIASNTFEVKPMPTPEIFLGGISNGQSPGLSSVTAQSRISLRYPPSIPLTGVPFTIIGGTVTVETLSRSGKILSNGTLDENAKILLRQSSGKLVTFTCTYRDPSQVTMNASPLVFRVR